MNPITMVRLFRPAALCLAMILWPEPVFSQGGSAPLLTTFTNPVPANSAFFGTALAAVGNDKVIISAGGAGIVYLFSTNGSLLTTFVNPNPGGAFGSSVAAVGSDRVIIGDYDTFIAGAFQIGSAYLFSTSGTLLTTFTNPAPAAGDAFGWSVAAVGNDRVVIGALADSAGAQYSGSAYLFNTNGTLITTFTNPTPAFFDSFGTVVAAMGSDRVLIGAPEDSTGAVRAGSAYLFNTDGALLTTFTNPAPVVASNFGESVASVGNDRVLIGAIDYNGSAGGGSAYLFSTNGTLLKIFTSPTRAAGDDFGYYLTAVGSNRVLIGAYLFTTNGTLLTIFTNPAPASGEWSALPVTAMGTDHVLIGDMWNDTGAMDSGAAYLFILPYPSLNITQQGNTVSMSWVTPETGLTLQYADALGAATVWINTSDSVSVNGLTNVVQQALATTNRFFRLHRP